MIARFDIQQGSIKWHELRNAKIGGSTSKGLFVKSDTLLIELLSESIEDFEIEDSYQSDDMIRGNELEPIAREKISKQLGVDFIECGWLQCEENYLLGISPDGITIDFKEAIEIKCPAKKKHTQTILLNEIPSDNICQCLHYFTVNPHLEKLHFISFRPESIISLFQKILTRESIIDLGTKAKPNKKTVSEWVEIAKKEAELLKIDLEKAIEKLSF
jgi:hypothetical protein